MFSIKRRLGTWPINEFIPTVVANAAPRRVSAGALPLGTAVPLKIKQAIWADNYVDFAELLYPSKASSFDFQYDPEKGGVIKLTKEKREIKTLIDWVKAFLIFVAVYVQQPARVKNIPDLVTYAGEVIVLGEKGFDFIYYDENYREQHACMTHPPRASDCQKG